MTDISNLLNWYQQFADDANTRNQDDRIEKMVKRHIRELAKEGDVGNNPLHPVSLTNECPPGWVDCDGSCLPPDVAC